MHPALTHLAFSSLYPRREADHEILWLVTGKIEQDPHVMVSPYQLLNVVGPQSGNGRAQQLSTF